MRYELLRSGTEREYLDSVDAIRAQVKAGGYSDSVADKIAEQVWAIYSQRTAGLTYRRFVVLYDRGATRIEVVAS